MDIRSRFTAIELFTGAGGGSLGFRMLGIVPVCYVEWDQFCQKVLQARIADGSIGAAPIWDDAKTFDGKPWCGRVDIVAAGFPCQPWSVAGNQKGVDDPRNLWPSTIRIIGEVQPPVVWLENVPGLLGAHDYFAQVLHDLAVCGYDARWEIVSAKDAGARHRRARLWILGVRRDKVRTAEFF